MTVITFFAKGYRHTAAFAETFDIPLQCRDQAGLVQ